MNEKMFWPEKIETEEKNNLENIVSKTIEKVECDGYELGSGKTAIVCGIKNAESICVKIINKEIKPKNGAAQEMGLLDYLTKRKLKTIKVPEPFCAAKTEKAEYLFMETISGFSVLDLIEKDLINQLPENFSFKEFFNDLKLSVEEMNNEQVFHCDLRQGNVMIDKKGNPVIIDFGESKKVHLRTENPYITKSPKGDTRIISSDEDRIIQLRGDLGNYLKNKNFFDK